jgi:hypothetical protein
LFSWLAVRYALRREGCFGNFTPRAGFDASAALSLSVSAAWPKFAISDGGGGLKTNRQKRGQVSRALQAELERTLADGND